GGVVGVPRPGVGPVVGVGAGPGGAAGAGRPACRRAAVVGQRQQVLDHVPVRAPVAVVARRGGVGDGRAGGANRVDQLIGKRADDRRAAVVVVGGMRTDGVIHRPLRGNRAVGGLPRIVNDVMVG